MEDNTKHGSYKKGSEGSSICSTNLRKYPVAQNDKNVSPSETDHEFGTCASKLHDHEPTATEQIRRDNNRTRDRRHRWAVITGPIAVDTNSDAAKDAD